MLNWIFIAIGLFLILLIAEEAINYYVNKLPQDLSQTSTATDTEKRASK